MIQVSTKSWHYRVVKAFIADDKKPPQSLCAYFWTLLGALVAFGAMSIAGIFFSVALLSLPVYWLKAGRIYFMESHVPAPNPIPKIETVLVAAGSAALMIILAALTLFTVVLVVAYALPRLTKFSPREGTFLSLVMSRFRAFKEKACPLINFVPPKEG